MLCILNGRSIYVLQGSIFTYLLQSLQNVKGFICENAVVKDGEFTKISTNAYLSAGMTVLFYVMVLAICFIHGNVFVNQIEKRA